MDNYRKKKVSSGGSAFVNGINELIYVVRKNKPENTKHQHNNEEETRKKEKQEKKKRKTK